MICRREAFLGRGINSTAENTPGLGTRPPSQKLSFLPLLLLLIITSQCSFKAHAAQNVLQVPPPSGNPSTDRNNIQTAIDQANIGDIVQLQPGTYLVQDPVMDLDNQLPSISITKGITLRGVKTLPHAVDEQHRTGRVWPTVVRGAGVFECVQGEKYGDEKGKTLKCNQISIVVRCLDDHAFDNVTIENIFIDLTDQILERGFYCSSEGVPSSRFGILNLGRGNPSGCYCCTTAECQDCIGSSGIYDRPDLWAEGANLQLVNCKVLDTSPPERGVHSIASATTGEVSLEITACEVTCGDPTRVDNYGPLVFVASHISELVLINNNVKGHGDPAATFYRLFNPLGQIVLSDNTLESISTPISAYVFASPLVATDNIVNSNGNEGITLGYTLDDPECSIENNTVKIEDVTDLTWLDTQAAIKVAYANNVTISKNNIVGESQYGILLEGSQNVVVKNNDLGGFKPQYRNPSFQSACFDSAGQVITDPYTNPFLTTAPSQPGFGEALQFTGVESVLIADPNPPVQLSETFTLTAWAKIPPDAPIPSDGFDIFSWGDYETFNSAEFRIARVMQNGGYVGTLEYGQQGTSTWHTVNSSIPITDGQWHHVALVKSAEYDYKLFVDGVSDTIGEMPGTVSSMTHSAIGARITESALDYNFYGSLDDIGFWNRALTEVELQQLSNPVLGIHPTDLPDALQAYYSCDADALVTQAYPPPSSLALQILVDNSGNGHFGVVSLTVCPLDAQPRLISGCPVYLDPGSHGNTFSGNVYGPFSTTVDFCSDFGSCDSSVKLNPNIPKAGIIASGNDNSFTNESFVGYPGWVDVDGNWLIDSNGYPAGSGAMIIRGSGNHVKALRASDQSKTDTAILVIDASPQYDLKFRGIPSPRSALMAGTSSAFNVCNQVIDANADYDPEMAVVCLDDAGYWDPISGPRPEPLTLVDLSFLGFGPVFLADPDSAVTLTYNWGWAYSKDNAGNPLLSAPLGNYVRDEYDDCYLDPDLPPWGPIWDNVLPGVPLWTSLADLQDLEGWKFYLGVSPLSLVQTTTAYSLPWGASVPMPTDMGGVPIYTPDPVNFVAGYSKCEHAPFGYIEKLGKVQQASRTLHR